MILDHTGLATDVLPDHSDGRTKRPEVGRVLTGFDAQRAKLELAILLEGQYKAQWKRWRFRDEHCARIVGAESERPSGEALEQDLARKLVAVRERLWGAGKRWRRIRQY